MAAATTSQAIQDALASAAASVAAADAARTQDAAALASVQEQVAAMQADADAKAAQIETITAELASKTAQLAELSRQVVSVTPPAPEPVATGSVMVTNHLAGGIVLLVEGVAPFMCQIAQGATERLPAAFWQAWKAKYLGSDFAGRLTEQAVD